MALDHFVGHRQRAVAALRGGQVDHHRARLHLLHGRFLQQHRRLAARDQRGGDDDVGLDRALVHQLGLALHPVRRHRPRIAAHALRDLALFVGQERHVEELAASPPSSDGDYSGYIHLTRLHGLHRTVTLKPSALFLLMRLAREAGHRLSDIVSASGHALERLRGRELFAYLKSLLGKPIDYGHVARTRKAQEDERHAADARAAQDQQEVARLIERYCGRRVSGPDGRIYEVDSASIVITEGNGRRSSLGHGQARAWLIEMDRAANGLAHARGQASSVPNWV